MLSEARIVHAHLRKAQVSFGETHCQLQCYHKSLLRSMTVGDDGEWFYRSAFPGNENAVGWGQDMFPHVHYDVACRGCETPNEIYPEGRN